MVTRPKRNVWKDYGITIGVAVALALGIRSFGLEAFRIPTTAMRPTLEPGDTIFVAKWPFGLRSPLNGARLTSGRMPGRGEIVLFSPGTDPGRHFIKRVIALPDEMVAIQKGRISINGKPLEVTLESRGVCGIEKLDASFEHAVCFEPPALEDYGPARVPADSVFVLGDLRSTTSPEKDRFPGWGMVKKSELQGLAMWTWLSIQPNGFGSESSGLFPRFRFERMFRRIQ